MHRIYLQDGFQARWSDQEPPPGGTGDIGRWAEVGGRVVITGEEAQHAVKVKRLGVGEMVELLDGGGTVARARVERAGREGREWMVEVSITSAAPAARVRPRVEVWSATPKGGRVDEMIDGLSQVGAAAWTPITTERGVVSPRETKLERLERVAWEAAKQCGRAWVLEIGQETGFAAALNQPEGVVAVLADGAGMPYEPTGRGGGGGVVRVLIGPEGGWSEAELGLSREVGVKSARFGPHAMRIETAAVVAAAMVLDQEGRAAMTPARGEGGEGNEDESAK